MKQKEKGGQVRKGGRNKEEDNVVYGKEEEKN
jgi:hypothetical protein